MRQPVRAIAPITAAVGLLTLSWPGSADAHTAERGLVMLLPTEYYLWGGMLAVLISFMILTLSPPSLLERWSKARWFLKLRWRDWSIALNLAGFALFAGLIIIGFYGVRDPLLNPLPLMVWTIGWVGFTLVCAVFGDLWRWINPWSAPMRGLRLLVGAPVLRLPDWVGYWPAILGFGLIAWFEIVSLAPDDPARLAQAALLYWLVQLGAMILFGEQDWRARGEALSVYFSLLGEIASVRVKAAALNIAWPGARVVAASPLGSWGWLFVIATIAGVTFDGLAGTFWWLGLNGINPLEFPGRSAVIALNSAGLIGIWLGMAVVVWGAVALGWILAGRHRPLGDSLGRLALSLIPISLAYHCAHYLTIFLVNGQYALVALSDPFATGADWLGLGQHSVTTSFLNDLASVRLIWRVQAAIVIVGHLIAVAAAHSIALQIYGSRRRAALSQVPLAVLMVGFTALGLWLLSTPTGA